MHLQRLDKGPRPALHYKSVELLMLLVRGNGPILTGFVKNFEHAQKIWKQNMDLKSFAQAIQQIADEKGIPKEKIFETIEVALAAAYKRDYGKRGQIVRAKLDEETGKVGVRQIKIVVDETMIKSEEEIAAEEAARQAGVEEDAKAGKEEIF